MIPALRLFLLSCAGLTALPAQTDTNFFVFEPTFGALDFGLISAAGPARQIHVGARLEF